jgi:salicylate hydroxylase
MADMARRRRIIIIGGGIGGLTAARALSLRDHEVEVFERAAAPGEVGAGLQVGPSAVKVLYALGLKDPLHAIACMPDCFATFIWLDASLMHRESYQETFKIYGAPYLTAHRADLHKVLLDSAADARMHVGKRCIGASSTPEGAVAHFADGSAAEADVVVGADGIHSAVREALWGKDNPRYTHYLGWRGVLPMQDALAVIGEEAAILHRKDVVLWRSPTGTMLFYPLRAGQLLNFFAGRYTDEWAEESWTVPSSRAELLAAFKGWPAERIRVCDLIVDIYKWAFFDRDPLARWSRGNVSLLGDAAHPMMPTLAQGAAITIEDAYVLARYLSDRTLSPADALREYEAERIGRASRVQILAREQFDDNRKVPPPPPRDRTWIFRHDVTAATAT